MRYLIIFIFLVSSMLSLAQSPSVVYPKNGQVLEDTAITLRWDAHPDAISYQLTLASDSLFQNKIINAQSTTDNRQPIYLNSNNTYHGYIIYNTPSSNFSSDTFSFTVFNPKDIDSLLIWLSVKEGCVLDSSSKIVRWVNFTGDTNFSAYQGDINKRPFYDSINELVFFNGNHYLFLGAPLFVNYSFIVCHFPTDNTTSRAILSQMTGWTQNGFVFFNSQGRQRSYHFNSGTNSFLGGFYQTGYNIDVIRFSGNQRKYNLNNNLIQISNSAMFLPTNGQLVLGGVSSLTSWRYIGKIKEVIIYNLVYLILV
jgi:hypothetical protein